ncbi:unnamed protein product [Linum trigynum]|uniref:3-dehydroquinate synthase n=1 Tax=Linum trigynum TaxID=586398 RepID=A0AAV2F282_9ROSI
MAVWNLWMCSSASITLPRFPSSLTQIVDWKKKLCKFDSWNDHKKADSPPRSSYRPNCSVCSSSNSTPSSASSSILVSEMSSERSKKVWILTQSKQVMTSAVERGLNTFLFFPQHRFLAEEWSSIALIRPLFIKEEEVLDSEKRRIATVFEVSTPQELQLLNPESAKADNVIVDLKDWQMIPAENIVAAFQGSGKTVFAISKSASEAQTFLEALEHGLGGVVLNVEKVEPLLELKDYLDRRHEGHNLLSLSKATITRIEAVGMGDRVCVDLCSLMRPGEGLLVGSFARGLFLVHSECLESNYIASRPFRVNAGPVHAYVCIPGGRTCYLSELKAGKEVIIADQKGRTRTAITGRVKIETRPLVLVEAKIESESETTYSIFLQNAETVALIPPICKVNEPQLVTAVPVTSLKLGDEVLLRVQGGARHTGIEIEEFIVES